MINKAGQWLRDHPTIYYNHLVFYSWLFKPLSVFIIRQNSLSFKNKSIIFLYKVVFLFTGLFS